MTVSETARKFSRKMALRAALLVALILILSWILSNFAGRGAGAGEGPGGGSSPAAVERGDSGSPRTPIQVFIQEDRYLVDGKEMTLDQILAAAGPGGGSAAAVKIVSGSDSRLGAERDLENALDSKHLPWALEAEPVRSE
jgi:hypothetical protein